MSNDDGQLASNPRTVSRGLNLQIPFNGIDSLYLIIEYPHLDLFERWSSGIEDLQDVKLYDGIAFDGYVLKRGGNGYHLSVWDGDARLYITPRVNDTLIDSPQEGQGMGAMLQLGPKWLRKYGDDGWDNLMLNIYGQFVLLGIERPQQYPIRINRLDWAIDLQGVDIGTFKMDTWLTDWVGRAKKKNFYTDGGALTGFAIGTSQGAIRFKAYNKVLESRKEGNETFWRSVWDVPEGEPITITRFEWTIKCYQAKFTDLRYLTDLTHNRLASILHYATESWGRLCNPQQDTNQSRWPLAPIWTAIRNHINQWSNRPTTAAKRDYTYNPDITDAYLNSFAGWIAGLMVRLGLNNEDDIPADIAQIFDYLHTKDIDMGVINQRALKKWDVLSKLKRPAYDFSQLSPQR